VSRSKSAEEGATPDQNHALFVLWMGGDEGGDEGGEKSDKARRNGIGKGVD